MAGGCRVGGEEDITLCYESRARAITLMIDDHSAVAGRLDSSWFK